MTAEAECKPHQPITLSFNYQKKRAGELGLPGRTAKNTHCAECGRTMCVDSLGVVAWIDLSLVPAEAIA